MTNPVLFDPKQAHHNTRSHHTISHHNTGTPQPYMTTPTTTQHNTTTLQPTTPHQHTTPHTTKQTRLHATRQEVGAQMQGLLKNLQNTAHTATTLHDDAPPQHNTTLPHCNKPHHTSTQHHILQNRRDFMRQDKKWEHKCKACLKTCRTQHNTHTHTHKTNHPHHTNTHHTPQIHN